MKLKLIIFLIIGAASFSSCNDKFDDVTDFSSSLSPYIEFSSKAGVTAKEGVNTNVAVRLKESFQQAVVANYEITGAGAKTGSITIPRGALTANIVLNFPAGTVPSSATTSTATITLKSATAGIEALTIGFAGTTQTARTITIGK